jgi:CBS domain-containing protein
VHRLLVLDGSELVGVVSRRDLAGSGDCPVSQVMGPEVFAIDASAQLGEAAAAFEALNIGCLPVVREGRLVGVLTQGDLRRAGLRLQ